MSMFSPAAVNVLLKGIVPPEVIAEIDRIAKSGAIQKILAFAEGLEAQNKLLEEILLELKSQRGSSDSVDGRSAVEPYSNPGQLRLIQTTNDGRQAAP